MNQNLIPFILKAKGWTKYRLWQELGGKMGDRGLIYERLAAPGAEGKPIPPATHWGTMKRVATALCVPVASLEESYDESSTT